MKELATPPSREPLLLKMARVGFPGAERFNIFGDKSQLGNDFYDLRFLDPDPRNPQVFRLPGSAFIILPSTSKKREKP